MAEESPRATQATKPPLCHALLLGLVQGPTEVLPVSSSAHIALLARLAGWPHAEQDAELRNSLEVVLHAGTAAALTLALRGELGQASRGLDGRAVASAALALTPPALVGYLMERRLERRPGSPRALATGLAVGAAAMAWADTRPGTVASRTVDPATPSRSVSRRRSPCSRASRATAPPSPPRALAASPARTPTRCRGALVSQ